MSNKNNDTPQPQKSPQQVTNVLDEWLCGSYVVFTLDQNGDPELFQNYLSTADSLALQHYIQTWLNVTHQINGNIMIASLVDTSGETKSNE